MHHVQATRLAQYPNYLNLEDEVKEAAEKLNREAVKLQKVVTGSHARLKGLCMSVDEAGYHQFHVLYVCNAAAGAYHSQMG